MLYPIRVQASTRDRSIQIIDTILIDPHCLPVTPSTCLSNISNASSSSSKSTGGNTSTQTSLLQKQTIAENAQYLANTLLADMEVHKVSKSNKSGRIRLLESGAGSLVQEVETQIATQIELILVKDAEEKRKRRQKLREQAGRKKRRLVEEKEMDAETEKEGNGDHDSDVDMDKEKIESKEVADKKSNDINKIGSDEGNTCDHDLIPIKIRLKENGICIVDEFNLSLDPSHPSLSNPILLATQLAKDLQIPPRLINSIAISIAEQICGFDFAKEEEEGGGITGFTVANKEGNASANTDSNNNNGAVATSSARNVTKRVQVDKNVPSAWKLDEKEEEVSMAHYLKVGTNINISSSTSTQNHLNNVTAVGNTATATAAALGSMIGNIVS